MVPFVTLPAHVEHAPAPLGMYIPRRRVLQYGARPAGARFTNYLEIGGRQAVMAQRYVNEKSLAATKRYQAIADEAGMPLITLATAWSKQHDFVASTIVGATHTDQLGDILAAADVVLGADILKEIDKVSKEILYPMG